jgi:ubiquinone/menaquinone biosynthesis C-methylase UbiE
LVPHVHEECGGKLKPLFKTADMPFKAAIEAVSDEFAPSLGPNGIAFLHRLYEHGLRNYQNRLTAVGLGSGGCLLDAGCGFGQWCFAAAGGYDNVVGVDFSEARIATCNRLGHLSGMANCSFRQGVLEHLPFANASFDAVISYSVLYFTDYASVLAELARVLSPSGKFYLSTNDVGRFLVDVVENRHPTLDFHPRAYGAATIARTALERLTGRRWCAGAVAMSKRRTVSALEKAGFEILEIGTEGSLGFGDKPMQRGRYAGFTAVFDVLARKI